MPTEGEFNETIHNHKYSLVSPVRVRAENGAHGEKTADKVGKKSFKNSIRSSTQEKFKRFCHAFLMYSNIYLEISFLFAVNHVICVSQVLHDSPHSRQLKYMVH